MFLLVPAYPGCPGSKAVKRSLLLLLFRKRCKCLLHLWSGVGAANHAVWGTDGSPPMEARGKAPVGALRGAKSTGS